MAVERLQKLEDRRRTQERTIKGKEEARKRGAASAYTRGDACAQAAETKRGSGANTGGRSGGGAQLARARCGRGRRGRGRRAHQGAQPLPARPHQEPRQGVPGGGALPAPAPEEQVHGVRGSEHLPAPAAEKPMHGVRGREQRAQLATRGAQSLQGAAVRTAGVGDRQWALGRVCTGSGVVAPRSRDVLSQREVPGRQPSGPALARAWRPLGLRGRIRRRGRGCSSLSAVSVAEPFTARAGSAGCLRHGPHHGGRSCIAQ